jgi:hypothetical protein
MLRPWLESASRLDVDKARDIALQLQAELRQQPPEPAISQSLESEVLQIIAHAGRELVH